MVVELRKRKAPPTQPEPAQKKTATAKATKKTSKAKSESATVESKDTAASSKSAVPKVGDIITLEGFGGEIQTQDGETTTLKSLVDSSKSGVVIFTYPRASTPGCTRQACLFRDGYENLTSTGLAIYGLSNDSPKANTTFKTKQKLPYPLLCDPSATLISSLGFKKSAKGTVRGVFVVDKAGKVLVLESGSPAGTVETVEKLVKETPAKEDAKEDTKEDSKEDAKEEVEEGKE